MFFQRRYAAAKKSDRVETLSPSFLIKPMLSLWKDLENGCVPAEAVPPLSAESPPFDISNEEEKKQPLELAAPSHPAQENPSV